MVTGDALCVDQRSFGRLFHRGYIRYEKSRGSLTLTNLGKLASQVFGKTNVLRREAGHHLSSYIRMTCPENLYQS